MGWLINPQDNQIEIYRKGQAVEILENPAQLSEVSGLKDLFEQIGEHKKQIICSIMAMFLSTHWLANRQFVLMLPSS